MDRPNLCQQGGLRVAPTPAILTGTTFSDPKPRNATSKLNAEAIQFSHAWKRASVECEPGGL